MSRYNEWMLLQRLRDADDAALQEFLEQRPHDDLFLLGQAERPLQNSVWMGAFDQDVLVFAALVFDGLVVPSTGSERGASILGSRLKGQSAGMVVGPRNTSDALIDAWSPGPPQHRTDQRLYVLEAPSPGATLPIRAATLADLDVVCSLSAAMNLEDIGRVLDPTVHRQACHDRIDAGRVMLAESDGNVVFTLNVGTSCAHGAQLGGTYVPPPHRGSGWATRALRTILTELLQRHPCVTLHVDEANAPAIRLYERVGFQRSSPMRLMRW